MLEDNNTNEENKNQEISENIPENSEQKENTNLKKKKKKRKEKKVKKQKGINFGLGTLILIVFCAFLMIMSTFLQLDVTHFIIPSKLFSGKTLEIEDFLYTIKYIPQIPVALFVVGLLGRRYGSLSIILYILLGLFIVPVFALGGGLRYILTYGFGYIFAFLPAGIILGTVLKKGYTYKNIAKAVFLGVLTIHLIGIIYMVGIAYINHAGIDFVKAWIISQSGLKIIYDLIFSYLIILVAKYTRIILWFYL